MEINMSELNKFFDKIYFINLDHRKDRYDECIKEFNKHNIIAERVSAIDGSLSFRIGLNRNAGAHGLVLTTINIIEDAIKNNYKNILIFEDDVLFNENLNTIFSEKVKFLPNDWDLIYLGGSHLFDYGIFRCISKEIDFRINSNNYKQLDHELCSTTWTQTTHAVGINSKIFNVILKNLKEKNYPLDIAYVELQQNKFKTYTFLPSIALQRPSYSDIEKVVVDYNLNKRWTF